MISTQDRAPTTHEMSGAVRTANRAVDIGLIPDSYVPQLAKILYSTAANALICIPKLDRLSETSFKTELENIVENWCEESGQFSSDFVSRSQL